MNSCIYNGLVTHHRFKPVKHSLKYKTFSLLLDLDELESLIRKLAFFLLTNLMYLAFIIKITDYVMVVRLKTGL